MWYARRRRTFRVEINPDFSLCAMLLNVQYSWSYLETNIYAVHITRSVDRIKCLCP